MLFLRTNIALLSLFSFVNSKKLAEKRATKTDVTLYVYGGDANGSPVFYADGLAYFGANSSGLNASVVTNIVFSLDTTDTTVPWTATPFSTSVSFNQTETMYLFPASGSVEQVGFTSSSSALPSGAVTTGFTFFGTSVAYAASSSNYELMFWGVPTSFNDTYGLYWKGTAAAAPANAFPVVVKTTPPITLTSRPGA